MSHELNEMFVKKRLFILNDFPPLSYMTINFFMGKWYTRKINCLGCSFSDNTQGDTSKTLPKAKLELRKGHGHYLVICCWLHPVWFSDHYIWEVCSTNAVDTPKTTLLEQALVYKIILIFLQDNAGLLVIQPTLQTLKALYFIHRVQKTTHNHFRETTCAEKHPYNHQKLEAAQQWKCFGSICLSQKIYILLQE